MRVLILSANTGGGHNSAANAVGEELKRKSIDFDIKDCLAFASELTSDVISFGHSYIYRHLPHLFGAVYAHEETHTSRTLYETAIKGVKNFAAFMSEHTYDVIVSSHVFASMLVTEWFHRYHTYLPHYFIATDYTCTPGVTMIDVDGYFIPHSQLKGEFIANGIQESKLLATGIPVSGAFSEKKDKQTARRELGLPEEGQIVLLSSGSMGCGHIHRIVPEFAEKLPENTTLVVICGRNMRSYRLLTEQQTPHTVIVGFTHRIADYMSAADICVSKPGGLTTTEMLAKGLPMVLMLAVPGCETRNLDFLTKEEVAVDTRDWDEAMGITVQLLQNEKKMNEMRRRMMKYSYGKGAERIVGYILEHHKMS